MSVLSVKPKKISRFSDPFQGQTGLSLIEISIAIVVISLVLMTVPSVWTQTTLVKGGLKQSALMLQLEQSMQMFLQINGYLPCPDTNGSGYENRETSGTCKDREGGLPYAELGFQESDAWGNPWYYRVHQRAESNTYINQVCAPASVFANSGNEDLTDFWLCPATQNFYCAEQGSASDCDSVCSEACVSGIQAHPTAYQAKPPYYHLATRPTGTLGVAYDMEVELTSGETVEGVIAVVASWGENGASQSTDVCIKDKLSDGEFENCNGDKQFFSGDTHRNRDYLLWFDMNQAKFSLIQNGRYR